MEAMAVKKQNIIQTIKDYGNQLFGFIRSRVDIDEDAEDILQDVWYQLSVLQQSEAIESISGWLYRVAKNKIIDRSRKKQALSLDDFAFEEDGESFYMSEILLNDKHKPETEHLRQLFWKELFAALKELPEKQRTVFVLNELEDMTLQQIADKDGENLKTIISRKRYAVQHLRNRLENLNKEIFNY